MTWYFQHSWKLLPGECHKTPLIISQHWLRSWIGVVRQQAIIWADVDHGLCCHMASLGHNELTSWVWWPVAGCTYGKAKSGQTFHGVSITWFCSILTEVNVISYQCWRIGILFLMHPCWVIQICISKLGHHCFKWVLLLSSDSLPIQCQVIFLTNAGLSLIWTLGNKIQLHLKQNAHIFF